MKRKILFVMDAGGYWIVLNIFRLAFSLQLEGKDH